MLCGDQRGAPHLLQELMVRLNAPSKVSMPLPVSVWPFECSLKLQCLAVCRCVKRQVLDPGGPLGRELVVIKVLAAKPHANIV